MLDSLPLEPSHTEPLPKEPVDPAAGSITVEDFGNADSTVDQATALQFLRAIYGHSGASSSTCIPDSEELGFNALLRPLISHSVGRLRSNLQERIPSLDGRGQTRAFELERALELLLPDLLKRLADIVTRSMVVEMHAARLTGRLTGSSSHERFQAFVQLMGSVEYATAIFEEYPAMAERVVRCCRRWEAFSAELLERLEADHEPLSKAFAADPEAGLGRLDKILGQGGDLHRGGRRVVVLEMTCGRRVVYKPRSLALDEHFQSLLVWLNRSVPECAFRTLGILNRRDYGWVEHVEYSDCETSDEIQSFYFHLGGLLAVLYALQANDFHYENIIACGPDPVLIDLETLFHPIVFDHTLHSEKYSVLDVGILPVQSGSASHLSLSALGADRSQTVTAMGWTQEGTDTQRFEARRVGLKDVTSRPQLDAEASLTPQYRNALLSGFRRIYGAISEHSEQWTAPGGLLDSFARDTTRYVLRPTRVYQTLLWNQRHPSRSREVHPKDHLQRGLATEIPFRPFVEAVIPSEATDLENGDVPIFHGNPQSTDLWDSLGRPIQGFLPRPPLKRIRERIQGFSRSDLDRQEWLIRQALSMLNRQTTPKTTRIPLAGEASSRISKTEPFLQLATRIGDFLDAKATRFGCQATWTGYHRVGDGFLMGYLPAELYSGQLGIVCFLAHLGEHTGSRAYRNLAQQGLAFFREQQLERLLRQGGLGAFDGLGGAAYVMAHLARLWPGLDLSVDTERILDRLEELIPEDRCLDMVSGAAGCASALLALNRVNRSERALDLGIRCGEVLTRAVDLSCPEITWQSDLFDRPLTGFSHGLSGIALALTRLAHGSHPGPDALLERVRRLIAYEDTFFDSDQGNWRDLRPRDDGAEPTDPFMWAWCHGAPGMVAARYTMAPLLPKSTAGEATALADRAVASIERLGGSSENNLCHGVFGNIDLLLSVASARSDDSLQRRCASYLRSAIAGLTTDQDLSVWLDNQRRLDLMLGVSGIGYSLLRMHNPTAVPSVLLLEAPAPSDSECGLQPEAASPIDREIPTV